MGIIKSDDVIAWEEEGRIYCHDCVENVHTARPLTNANINEEDIVICDKRNERIQ